MKGLGQLRPLDSASLDLHWLLSESKPLDGWADCFLSINGDSGLTKAAARDWCVEAYPAYDTSLLIKNKHVNTCTCCCRTVAESCQTQKATETI